MRGERLISIFHFLDLGRREVVVYRQCVQQEKEETAGTTFVPSSAPVFPPYGSLLRRNPSLSAVCQQTPRLGHAQRYLNARFRGFGIFSAPQTRG